MDNFKEEIEARLARDFEGFPLALAAAISEIRTMAECPAMLDAVLVLMVEVSSPVEAMYQFARMRGWIWLPVPAPRKSSGALVSRLASSSGFANEEPPTADQ
jgi:hypothetical protein